MKVEKLYRRRYIPNECLLLKDDTIIKQTDDVVVTRWKTIHPKPTFSHGCSCYFLKKGIKVSKIYGPDNQLVYWYCDIVEYSYDEEEKALTSTDLLADVIVYPDGHAEVIDLDELAEALEKGMITTEQMASCLRSLNVLLEIIHQDRFCDLQKKFEDLQL